MEKSRQIAALILAGLSVGSCSAKTPDEGRSPDRCDMSLLRLRNQITTIEDSLEDSEGFNEPRRKAANCRFALERLLDTVDLNVRAAYDCGNVENVRFIERKGLGQRIPDLREKFKQQCLAKI